MLKIIPLILFIFLTSCDFSKIFGPNTDKEVLPPDKNPKFIIVEPSNILMRAGDEKIINSYVYMEDGSVDNTNGNITWESEDRSIAEIETTGKLKAIRTGETGIFAKHKTGKVTTRVIAKILGKKIVEKIVVTPTSLDLKILQTGELLATVYMADGTKNGNVLWSSSDNTIAKVSEFGKVTAIKKGTTTVVATFALDPLYRQSVDINVSE